MLSIQCSSLSPWVFLVWWNFNCQAIIQSSKLTTGDSPPLLFEEYWQWSLSNSPELASSRGFPQYDDKLKSESLDAYERRKNIIQSFLDRVFKLMKMTTNYKEKFNLKVLQWELELQLERINNKKYEFPIDNTKGPQVSFKNVISNQRLENVTDYLNYLSRLKALPKQIEEDIVLMTLSLKEGRTHHNISVYKVPETITKLLVDPKDTMFFEPFQESKMPKSISQALVQNLTNTAITIIREEIQPAFKKLKYFIEKEYMKGLRSKVGLHEVPGGIKLYKYYLQKFTSTTLSPSEIHEVGLSEVRRLDGEIKIIMKFLNFNGSLRDFVKSLENNPRFLFKTKEEIIKAAENLLFNVITPAISSLFWTLPKAPLIVGSFPDNFTLAKGAYYPQSHYKSATFKIATSPINYVAKYEVLNIALHEGIPGHHLTNSHSYGIENMYEFRKRPLFREAYTAYREGWSLYAEYLGLEHGLFRNPYDRFGYYSSEVFRAIRLVVDTGLHYYGWSKQQAIDFFINHSPLSVEVIENEVDRYITMPGQACAYKIGELKIKELRQKAKRELALNFDIRDFHQAVLDCGSVSLSILEFCVNTYIQSKRMNGSLFFSNLFIT